MGKIKVARASSIANTGTFVGLVNAKKKTHKIHGYSISSRGADFAADVQCELHRGYTGTDTVNRFTFTGVEADHIAAASYTSNFTADADDWVELTDGDLAIAGNIDFTDGASTAKTDCLRLTAGAAPDDASIKRPSTVTSGKYYKVTCSVAAETGCGLDGSFVMLGANGDAWDQVYDHDSGQHPEIVAEDTWYDITMYGKADATDLEICIVTAKNGQTEDQIVNTKDVYFHNIKVYEIQNVADGVPSAETDFGWCGADQGYSCDAGAGGTITFTPTSFPATAGDWFYVGATQGEYVAQNVSITAYGGTAIVAPAANGAFAGYVKSDGTDTLILTADGTGDSDIGTLFCYKLLGVGASSLVLRDTIQNGDVQNHVVTFPAPVWMGTDGWAMCFTTGGASSILDVNVFYEEF